MLAESQAHTDDVFSVSRKKEFFFKKKKKFNKKNLGRKIKLFTVADPWYLLFLVNNYVGIY